MTLALPYFICHCCKQCQGTRYRHRAFSATPYYWSQVRNSSYYDLLGIKKDATAEEIKQAFFSKSKKLHPDSNPDNPDLHEQFVKLNEAYTVLSKESSRRQYDSRQAGQAFWAPPPGRGPQRQYEDFAVFRRRSKKGPHGEEQEEWSEYSFYQRPFSAAEAERRERRNHTILRYLILFIVCTTTLEILGYRKLSELNQKRVDERNRYLTQIYNESKERARARKQQQQQQQRELLSQKQKEFIQRYYLRCKQFSAAPGPLGSSIKGQAPPVPTAK
ncbi:hypothetical protein JRQ81_009397 [Phrynocephalus forsythii]|uniref:J domain-containing protein n=1 Tax=Phrynocephalus forsythii TaxID=171643 RepID=A0A9Q0XD24_9SAUR|nr:hypothetical protein JRQ81_009397 [Phrynocephalus forsythii]